MSATTCGGAVLRESSSRSRKAKRARKAQGMFSSGRTRVFAARIASTSSSHTVAPVKSASSVMFPIRANTASRRRFDLASNRTTHELEGDALDQHGREAGGEEGDRHACARQQEAENGKEGGKAVKAHEQAAQHLARGGRALHLMGENREHGREDGEGGNKPAEARAERRGAGRDRDHEGRRDRHARRKVPDRQDGDDPADRLWRHGAKRKRQGRERDEKQRKMRQGERLQADGADHV